MRTLRWAGRRLAPGAETFSDGLACLGRFVDLDHAHTVLESEGGRAATEVTGARWANVVLGNVKRTISGCYHAVRQAKYVRRYLAEAAWRFNRRFHLPSMLPRLVHAMMLCKPRAEPRLRNETNFLG